MTERVASRCMGNLQEKSSRPQAGENFKKLYKFKTEIISVYWLLGVCECDTQNLPIGYLGGVALESHHSKPTTQNQTLKIHHSQSDVTNKNPSPT